MGLWNYVSENNVEGVKTWLKDSPDDVDTHDGCSGWNILMEAATKGFTEMVDLLLATGANPNYGTLGGSSPIAEAAHGGYADIIHSLVVAGANVDSPDEDGMTPLQYAAANGRVDAVRQLLESKADIDLRDNDGRTALMYGSKYGYEDVVKVLLEYGADVSFKAYMGLVCPHLGLMKGEEKTALETAREGGFFCIVQVIEDHVKYTLPSAEERRSCHTFDVNM